MADRRPLEDFERSLLDEALREAEKSARTGGFPAGAAIGAPDGRIVSAAHSLSVQSGDSTAHAELVAIREAGRRSDWGTLVMATTFSPCPMCRQAIAMHRFAGLIVGSDHACAHAAEAAPGQRVVLASDERCRELAGHVLAERPDLWRFEMQGPGAL